MYWEERAMRELMHEEREREHMCVVGKACWSSRERNGLTLVGFGREED